MNWTDKYKKAVTFSYDDGVEQDLHLLEILDKYGLKATFNLNTGLDDKSDNWIYKERLEVKRLNLVEYVNAYKGHEIAVHTLTHPNLCHHDDERLFELAERFLEMETDKPQIFYVWGHAYEFEGNNNWDRFEKFCKLISGRDDIFYGTNKEVLLS